MVLRQGIRYRLYIEMFSARSCPSSVHVVSPTLGLSLLSSFRVVWSPSGDTRGPSVGFEAVDVACPGPLQCSHIAAYVYYICPIPDESGYIIRWSFCPCM